MKRSEGYLLVGVLCLLSGMAPLWFWNWKAYATGVAFLVFVFGLGCVLAAVRAED